MINHIQQLRQKSKDKHTENKKYFAKLKKKPPKSLDLVMKELHADVFEEMNCLSCANCCKTTGPLFTQADISRIAGFLKLKPQAFIDRYLTIDEDNDYVLQQLPCAFLDQENYCLIYEARPKACKEYPHTDRKKIYQIAYLTSKNTAICPATFEIIERMKRKIPF